eukprot:TRINITY_DN2135_c0_g1_i1.p3 TRINITY_DN2135_c0_g1~~TRINITY_DN2135_c0_g1_i1.p3  ORF type:complete len:351 (-),score=46.00 TRINITY_DN2135_c0_g1_i1:1647-2699(-)
MQQTTNQLNQFPPYSALIPLLTLLKDIYSEANFGFKITTVVGSVSSVLPTNKVVVAVSQEESAQELVEVPFDFLIIGTGMKYPLYKGELSSLVHRKEEIERLANKLKTAKSIVLVGGGPVGVETAGEILSTYPNKSVTLIHIGSKLLDGSSYFVRLKATATLKSQGATVLLKQKIQSVQTQQPGLPQLIQTSRGKLVEADVTITTTGNGSPNTEFLEENFRHSLTPKGLVKVSKSLLVYKTANMFALGDVPDLPTFGKLYANIPQQTKIVINNLTQLMNYQLKKSDTLPKLAEYGKGMKSPMVISIGPDYGIKVEKGFFKWFTAGLQIGHMKTAWFNQFAASRKKQEEAH